MTGREGRNDGGREEMNESVSNYLQDRGIGRKKQVIVFRDQISVHDFIRRQVDISAPNAGAPQSPRTVARQGIVAPWKELETVTTTPP